MKENTGVIFEGGGMRGIFVTGVIDYFLENKIYFPHVYGVSAGACNACSYVSRQVGRAYGTATEYLDDPAFSSIKSLRRTGNYFNADFIYKKIPESLYPIDNDVFKASGTEFRVSMTNCITGEAEYPQVNDLFEDIDYVRASASLPLLSELVPIDGYCYLDGGIADSIPVIQSVKDGNTKNVVVLTRPLGYRKKPNKAIMPMIRAKYHRYPKLIEAVEKRYIFYNESLKFIEEGMKNGTVFVIAPMGDLNIGRTEKNKVKLRKAYEEGYFVAEGLSARMQAFLDE